MESLINIVLISFGTAIAVNILARTAVPSSLREGAPNNLLVDVSPDSIATIVAQTVAAIDNDQGAIMAQLNHSIQLQYRFESNQPSIGQIIRFSKNGIAAQCTQNTYVGFNGLNSSSNIDALFYCNLTRGELWIIDQPPNDDSTLNTDFFSHFMLSCSATSSIYPVVVGCRNCKSNAVTSYGPFIVGPYCSGESPVPNPTALWIYTVDTISNVISCLVDTSQQTRPSCVFLNQANGSP